MKLIKETNFKISINSVLCIIATVILGFTIAFIFKIGIFFNIFLALIWSLIVNKINGKTYFYRKEKFILDNGYYAYRNYFYIKKNN